jgi:hypothetical protein
VHWLVVWEVPSAAARTRSAYPTPSARLGSGRRYRAPLDSCDVPGCPYRVSDGVMRRTRAPVPRVDAFRPAYSGIGTVGARAHPAYSGIGTAFRWLHATYRPASTRRWARPSRASDRHDRAWTARHAVPIAPSARGRVPDSRSCGEIAYLPNQEPVHSEVSRTRACSETRSRKNGKRVPDSGRGRTVGSGVWTAML